MLSIGVDVGGTFTDFTVLDEETGQVRTTKSPTTSPDPLEGVLAGLEELRVDLATVRRFVHGTTIATNAIIQRRGAKTAFITTKSFEDHIEIGDSRRYTGGQFDPEWVRTRPLAPRPLRFGISERVSANGKTITPLNESDVLKAIKAIKKQKVESVAVGFLHSYTFPDHERRVGELLDKYLPEIDYSLSSDLVQEWREYPRFNTAVVNAYVMPLLKGYVRRLAQALQKRGYVGEVHFMTSSGGAATGETSARYPARLILSGPAAGAMAGAYLGEVAGWDNLITYDMGGTSTDVTLIKNLSPEIATRRVLGAFPILTPMLDVNTIGAGGGSIAWVDRTSALRVGPQSAGANPGPACYGLGGTEFTVTDANLLLGRIGPSGLIGGKMPLNRKLAEQAARTLGEKVGVGNIYQLAEGVIRIVSTNMAGAVREVSIERGHDPRDFALVAVGGAGALHAMPVAEELGIPAIVVPPAPGNFCAMGALTTDIKHDYIRTYKAPLGKDTLLPIQTLFAEMTEQGRRALEKDGFQENSRSFQYTMFLRYLGQAWELELPVETDPIELQAIQEIFHKEHLRAYGYNRPTHTIELVNLRLTAVGHIENPPTSVSSATQSPVGSSQKERRQVYFSGEFIDCPVYQREKIVLEDSITGPAVIEEFGSVTIVFPGWIATVDKLGNLRAEPNGRSVNATSSTNSIQANEAAALDPITLEVVQAFFVNTTREMGATLSNSAWSPALSETLDFGVAVLNTDGELLAASEYLPFHTFAIGFHVRYALEQYTNDIHPGDVFVTNDPYTSGPHLNDMVILHPFFTGDKLALFIAVRAHWTDVGGKVPGSMVGQAREIYEEGIRVPMTKIYHKGKRNKDLWLTILANCRNSDQAEGDFSSMLGTARTAERRLQELYQRYSTSVVDRCVEAILDRSDKTVRNAVAQLKDGEYYYEEYMENNGNEPGPVPLKCKLTVAGETMVFDFTGSSPQVYGPINAGPAMGYTGVFNMVKSFLERDTPVNSGAMRSVQIIQEEGSFLHATLPHSVAAYSECCYLVENAFMGLLAQIIPEKIGAPPECGANHTYISGFFPELRQHWITYEFPRGGMPASPSVDGSHVVVTYDLGDIPTLLPIEMMELNNPVLVLGHKLRENSEGAGYRRSGLGSVKEVKVLSSRGALLSLMGETAVIPRMGMSGGYPGGLNIFKVRRGSKEFHPGNIPSKLSGYPLQEGDIVRERSRGCGGWGDPLTREVGRVEEDVAYGYINKRRAKEAYGVVFTNNRPDEAATESLRAKMRSERPQITVAGQETDLYGETGCRICPVSQQMAIRLGAQDDDPVEYIPEGLGPHIKAWVRIDPTLSGTESPLGPRGRGILKAKDGDRIWIRILVPPNS